MGANRITGITLSVLAVTGSFIALQSAAANATEPGTDGYLATSANGGTVIGNADGTGQHTPSALSSARYATWSSDGSRIAWQNIAGSAGLVVSDPDGAQQKWIPGTDYAGGPTWYDSNTKLVFADSSTVGSYTQLYSASVLGNGPKTPLFATDTGCSDTHPLARGNLIAFNRSCASSPTQVWIYDKTAGAAHKVLDNASDADISPDGTKLVFSRSSDLFVSAINGSGATQLTTTGATENKLHAVPVWSPSGTRIAFYSNRGINGQDTEIVDVATKAETVWLGWSWGSPSWQPINPSAPKPPMPPNDRGTYYPMSPMRILDTREGVGAPKSAVGSGGVVTLQITGVPSDASTVVLNVTVTGATGPGFITAYPTGVTRPTASSLNYTSGWTGANSVTVKLGANGKVDLYNAGGPTHIIADVFGYYTQGHQCCATYTGGQYHPLGKPVRLTDTRDWGIGRVPGGYWINSIASWNDSINPHVRAFAVNITATDTAGGGFLTAWDGNESTMPQTSTLNYTKNATVPNFAVVPSTPCYDCGTASGLPSIGVLTSADAHIIVDIVGFYDDGTLPGGLRFTPVVPTRIADTRGGEGWPSRLGPGTTATITAPGSIADADTWALAMNVTAVQPTSATYLTVWPSGATRPTTSNLNPTAGSVVPNAVQTMISADHKFDVFNAGGYCDVVVDVVGTFYEYPSSSVSSNSTSTSTPVTAAPSPQFKRY